MNPLEPFPYSSNRTAFFGLFDPQVLASHKQPDLVRMHLRARRGDTRFRVAYLNHLHAIIARPGRVPEIPRNKVGAALVGDFDCIDADVCEQVEAILRAEGLWTEDKTK